MINDTYLQGSVNLIASYPSMQQFVVERRLFALHCIHTSFMRYSVFRKALLQTASHLLNVSQSITQDCHPHLGLKIKLALCEC
jgi:hypothetical protein